MLTADDVAEASCTPSYAAEVLVQISAAAIRKRLNDRAFSTSQCTRRSGRHVAATGETTTSAKPSAVTPLPAADTE
jgi:hypothetical protein